MRGNPQTIQQIIKSQIDLDAIEKKNQVDYSFSYFEDSGLGKRPPSE